jgi:hypothetical protein
MYIAVDVGGTNIRVASAESLEPIVLQNKVSFENSSDYEANIRRIIKTIRELSPTITAVAMSCPGRVNEDNTLISAATYVPQWINQPFIESLKDALQCPVVMRHDSECAAWGEILANKDSKDFYCIGYGTGIGGSKITYTSGQLTVKRVSDEIHGQYFKPWQLHCGGEGIKQRFNKPAETLSEAEWAEVMDDFYGYLVTFIEEMNASHIVFCGGIAVKQWSRLEPVFARVKREHPELQNTAITLIHFGEDAQLYGALTLLQSNKKTV